VQETIPSLSLGIDFESTTQPPNKQRSLYAHHTLSPHDIITIISFVFFSLAARLWSPDIARATINTRFQSFPSFFSSLASKYPLPMSLRLADELELP
jgi:hypothetical protein